MFGLSVLGKLALGGTSKLLGNPAALLALILFLLLGVVGILFASARADLSESRQEVALLTDSLTYERLRVKASQDSTRLLAAAYDSTIGGLRSTVARLSMPVRNVNAEGAGGGTAEQVTSIEVALDTARFEGVLKPAGGVFTLSQKKGLVTLLGRFQLVTQPQHGLAYAVQAEVAPFRLEIGQFHTDTSGVQTTVSGPGHITIERTEYLYDWRPSPPTARRGRPVVTVGIGATTVGSCPADKPCPTSRLVKDPVPHIGPSITIDLPLRSATGGRSPWRLLRGSRLMIDGFWSPHLGPQVRAGVGLRVLQ